MVLAFKEAALSERPDDDDVWDFELDDSDVELDDDNVALDELDDEAPTKLDWVETARSSALRKMVNQ